MLIPAQLINPQPQSRWTGTQELSVTLGMDRRLRREDELSHVVADRWA